MPIRCSPLSSSARRSPTAALAALVLALAGAAVVATGSPGATAAPAAPTSPDQVHPTFAAGYLAGVSGTRPERTVSLAGTWAFKPLTNTVCAGGGQFGTTTGPMSCTDSPAAGEETTIQVPGGGWLKQGYTDLSEAIY